MTVINEVLSTKDITAALKCGGEVGSHSDLYERFGAGLTYDVSPGNTIAADPRFGLRAIKNRQVAVLVGNTPMARRLLAEARQAVLVAEGISPQVAVIAATMPYGMEVARYAQYLVAEVAVAERPFADRGRQRGHAAFEAWLFRFLPEGLREFSYPRTMAALAIAVRVERAQRDSAWLVSQIEALYAQTEVVYSTSTK